jgi:hypothetical protein
MIPERLKDQLRRAYGLEPLVADQLWKDLLAYFEEDPQEYVRRRHIELQDQGFKNQDIYRLLGKELTSTLFPGPKLTQRQIRRMIYG